MKSFLHIQLGVLLILIALFLKSIIYIEDIEYYSNNFLYIFNIENLTNSDKHKSTKNFKCSRELIFDKTLLCFPKLENWKECRLDKNLKENIDELELNNKILAFYIPINIYDNSKGRVIMNYPLISLFVNPATIGMRTNEQVLPMVFVGLKNSFETKNWLSIKNLLQTKTNVRFLKPILFDSYSNSKMIKTCVTINTTIENGKALNRVSFINILDLKQRVLFLNYSKAVDEDFQFSEMKEENDQITMKFLENN